MPALHECIACSEPYALTPRSRHALCLPCGHTACRSCLLSLQRPFCPVCRSPFHRNVEAMAPNYQLHDVLAATSATSSTVTLHGEQICLSDLPLDLWKRIVTLACEGSDEAAKNTILTALRIRSKTIREACDGYKTSIILRRKNIRPATPYLQTLPSLVDVTVCMEDGITLGRPLLRLSTVVPRLTSLTLKQGPDCIPAFLERRYPVKDMATVLQPFRDNLLHLCVQNCKLTYESTNSRSAQPELHTGWSPDLSALQSLTLNDCMIISLNLFDCPSIRILEVIGNPLLKNVNLLNAGALHTLVCKDNPKLRKLNLSRCMSLLALECHDNDRLSGLTLPDKQGIQFQF